MIRRVILITSCLAILTPLPADAQRRPRRDRSTERITRQRDDSYSDIIRERQTERRRTEYRRLRERQRDAFESSTWRGGDDGVMDSIDESDCC